MPNLRFPVEMLCLMNGLGFDANPLFYITLPG